MGRVFGKGFSFFLSFFFGFCFKGLKASCYVSLEHMKGSTYFPHTVAPNLRPQECKVSESKQQRDRTFQMAGLSWWNGLPRKLDRSPQNRSRLSHSLQWLGNCRFSSSSSPDVSPGVQPKRGRTMRLKSSHQYFCLLGAEVKYGCLGQGGSSYGGREIESRWATEGSRLDSHQADP